MKNYTKDIPRSERESLTNFFKHFIIEDSWGYVLIGSKPMSISSTKNSKLLASFELLKKHEKKYEDNFIFFKKTNDISKDYSDLVVINKKLFFKKIKKYKIFFFTDEIDEKNVFSLFKDGKLLGIFLGYGKENSKAFYRSRILKDSNIKLDFFLDRKDRFKIMMKHFGCYKNNINYITMPSFMVCKDYIETKRLKKKYSQAKKDIINHFANKDFLEGSFELLVEKR